MKKIILLFTFLLFMFNGYAVNSVTINKMKNDPQVEAFANQINTLGLDQFLNLTPNKYREMTGERMSFGKVIKLKAAQSYIKSQMDDDIEITKGLYILAVIIGWGFLVIGLNDNWKGSDWIVNLVLTALCWLPGVIHGLMKMKKYYS